MLLTGVWETPSTTPGYLFTALWIGLLLYVSTVWLVTALGGLLDRRAAGEGQTEHTGHFVEGLAGRIVDRAPQQLELQRAAAAIQARVPTADHQRDAGEHVLAAGDAAGIDVGLKMVHRHQRNIQRQRQCLGRGQAYQQRAG